MYLVLEALADGGVKMGLPRTLALRLAAQTMMVGDSVLRVVHYRTHKIFHLPYWSILRRMQFVRL